jgi:hypothetical protein
MNKKMKTFGILFGAIAAFGFAVCNSGTDSTYSDTTTVIKEQPTTVTPDNNTTNNTIVVPADAPTGTTVKTNPDGTQILVDRNGVEWKSKSGKSETQIKVDRDSGGRIIIRK